MRNARSAVKPPPAESASSTMDKITTVASNMLNRSLLYSSNPMPITLLTISRMNMIVRIRLITSRAFA